LTRLKQTFFRRTARSSTTVFIGLSGGGNFFPPYNMIDFAAAFFYMPDEFHSRIIHAGTAYFPTLQFREREIAI
jgi:hypothetical protein